MPEFIRCLITPIDLRALAGYNDCEAVRRSKLKENNMQKIQESVLYYHHGDARSARKVLSVFVRLGIRIRRVEPGQVMEKVGYLAGLPGYGPAEETKAEAENAAENAGREASERPLPELEESVLVMRNFTGGRLDYLLYNLRKSGIPPIPLKAVLTPSNADWTFYQLYEELKEEHARMHAPRKEGNEDD